MLLLRLTQKRFSATQYSLMSSLFALPRILSGPIAGIVVDAVGWVAYFWFAVAAGIPGLLLLRRFAPFGGQEPNLEVDEAPRGRSDHVAAASRLEGSPPGLRSSSSARSFSASLTAFKAMRATPPVAFDLVDAARGARTDGHGRRRVRLFGLLWWGGRRSVHRGGAGRAAGGNRSIS